MGLSESRPDIWLRALVGFGGVAVLGLIGFIIAWRGNRPRAKSCARGTHVAPAG